MRARDGDYYDDELEPQRSNRKPWLWGSVVLVVVLLVGVAVAFRAARQARDAEAIHRDMAQREAELAEMQAGRDGPRRDVTLLELHQAFWADAVAAEKQYGERPRFTMRVDLVETDAGGDTWNVIQETGEPESIARPRLMAKFRNGDGLRIGDTITARGKLSLVGRTHITMTDCELD